MPPRKIPFYRHDLGEAELEQIRQVFSGPILTTGDYVLEFEKRFSGYLGLPHTIACSSWTGTAHIALLALGIGPGDEVITTPLTFIATATAIIQAGAKPVFVDVEASTGNIDISKIPAAITPKTKAVMPVHLYGLMCDMKALRSLADTFNLKIIEDAAHCVEGARDGIRPGQLSDAVCFSFFATKNLACGEGGAVSVHDPDLDASLRLLRLHGMNRTSADREKYGYQHWDMVQMGWKYNMDNIHAAILLPQLELLEWRWQNRQRMAEVYQTGLREIAGLRLPDRPHPGKHANHLYPIWVEPEIRDALIFHLAQFGVATTVNYRAIHLLSYFKEHSSWKIGDFPIAEILGDGTISLPFFNQLTADDQHYVIDSVTEGLTLSNMSSS